MLSTVRRAGETLDLFRKQNEWGVSAVAAELGIAKSQAHELLISLSAIGLVRRSGYGRYRLGWGAVSLGQHLLRQEFRGGRATAVRRLAAATGQWAHLVALDRSRVVVLAASRGRDQLEEPVFSEDGLHCTAAGKLLLATQGADRLDALLVAGLRAFTPRTITCPDEARRHLEQVADRGIAVDVAERDARCCSIAMPVSSQDRSILAALTLTTTIESWARYQREYVIVVRREATALSRKLRDVCDDPLAEPAAA